MSEFSEDWKAAIEAAKAQLAEEERRVREAEKELSEAMESRHAVQNVIGRLESVAAKAKGETQ